MTRPKRHEVFVPAAAAKPPMGPRKAYYLSPKQRSTYEVVAAYVALHGTGPTLRVLCAALGIAQHARVTSYLRRLQAWGFVTWERGDYATLRVSRELPAEAEPLRRARAI